MKNARKNNIKPVLTFSGVLMIIVLLVTLYMLMSGVWILPPYVAYIEVFFDVISIMFILNLIFYRMVNVAKIASMVVFSAVMTFLMRGSMYPINIGAIIYMPLEHVINPIVYFSLIIVVAYLIIRMGGQRPENSIDMHVSRSISYFAIGLTIASIAYFLMYFMHLSMHLPVFLSIGSIVASPAIAVNIPSSFYIIDDATIYYKVDMKTRTLLTSDTASTKKRYMNRDLPSIEEWNPDLWVGKTLYGYQVTKTLGKGGTSYVMLGNLYNEAYAMKIPLFSRAASSMTVSTYNDLITEGNRLQEISARSSFIVRLYAIHADRNIIKSIVYDKNAEMYLYNPPVIVMEPMWGGSAHEMMMNDNIYFSKDWKYLVAYIVEKMAYALNTVHENGYVHLDIKPENILFSKVPGKSMYEVVSKIRSGEFVPKLSDLGSSSKIGSPPMQYTRSYVPLDQIVALALKKGSTPAMDIYALGATTYTLLTRRTYNNPIYVKAMDDFVNYYISTSRKDPMLRLTFSAKLSTMKRAFRLPVQYNDVPTEFIPIISKMTARHPSARPSATEVARYMNAIYSKWITS